MLIVMRLASLNRLVGEVVKVRVPRRLRKALRAESSTPSAMGDVFASGRVTKIQIDGRMPRARIAFASGTYLIRAADVVA